MRASLLEYLTIRTKILALILAITPCGLAHLSCTFAQSPIPAGTTPAGTILAGTMLAEQTELARLIDLASSRLGVLITYDATTLKSAKVMVRQPRALSDEDLWILTNRLLMDQGFAMTRGADAKSMSVVKVQLAAQSAVIEIIDASAYVPGRLFRGPDGGLVPGFRRVLLHLWHTSSKDALAAAQVALSKPGGSVSDFDAGDAIVVSDYSPFVDSVIRLLIEVDDPGNSSTIEDFAAQNIEPVKLIALAKQLADRQRAGGGKEPRGDLLPAADGAGVLIVAPSPSTQVWKAILKLADTRESAERRTYSPTSFALKDVAALIEQTVRPSGGGDDRWRLIQDDLTGSLIITATADQHAQIQEVVERLNSVPSEARRPVRTFKIRNRNVRDIQRVLEDLLRSGVLESSAAAVKAQVSAAPGVVSPRTGTEMSAPVQNEQRSSALPPVSPPGTALFIEKSGTPPFRSEPISRETRPGLPVRSGGGNSLTLTSDEATSTLVAMGEPRLLAEIQRLLPTLDVRQPQVMLEAILVSLSDSQSVNFGVELERLQLSGNTFIRLSSLFGLSGSSGSGPGASRTVGDSAGFTGAVLSPGDFSIVVRALESINNGRSLSQPKVLVNNNEQATFNSVLQQPFASTFTPVSSGATTSFGGTQDAGTTITVKPQIAEGDHLVLTYSISLSSFVGAAASANLPPPRQQNSVQSVATIPDGFTVVVGGLELNTNGNGVTQIPVLGNIPILGELFKNRSISVGRQRFYVFLRANVLRDNNLEDLKYLSELDVTRAGVEDGWPQVKPRVIR